MSNAKLNKMQEKFCHEYIIDLNASQAAIRAGYSSKGSGVIGFKLLKITKIQNKITELLAARAEATQIKAENVIKELAENVFFDPAGIYDDSGEIRPFKDWPAICRRMNKSFDCIETPNGTKIHKVRWNDRGKYMELLMRHLGLLHDKLEVAAEDVTLRGILDEVRRRRVAREAASGMSAGVTDGGSV